jgi:hypothetical protein
LGYLKVSLLSGDTFFHHEGHEEHEEHEEHEGLVCSKY